MLDLCHIERTLLCGQLLTGGSIDLAAVASLYRAGFDNGLATCVLETGKVLPSLLRCETVLTKGLLTHIYETGNEVGSTGTDDNIADTGVASGWGICASSHNLD